MVGPESSAARPATRRILVVDDNIAAADSLADLLRLRGHDVQRALDGESALAAISAFDPDLVLLDIGLPGIDGYQVAVQWRRTLPAPGPRLVALTGHASADDRRRSQAAGFDDHLSKPVEFGRLEELVASVPARPRWR